MMRRGVPEEEAYRRVKQQQAEKRRVDDAEATLAQQQAQSLGLSPAARSAATASSADTAAPGERTREGFAARLLRRFAEEARAGGQPYPLQWFDDKGRWIGIATDDPVSKRTARAFERAQSYDELARETELGAFNELARASEQEPPDGPQAKE